MYFQSKTANETKVYTFTPDLAETDGIASFTASGTGVTVGDTEHLVRDIIVSVSGGTAGQTASVLFVVTTENGEVLEKRVYIPIVATSAQIANTARDYVNFALRKITGNGEDPSASELSDALERLNAMVAEWRAGGADIGAAFPLVAGTVIYCPDWAVSALRYNLLIECAPLYGAEPSAIDYDRARRGLQLIKHKNLPTVRTAGFF
jgi:hypothetical protein